MVHYYVVTTSRAPSTEASFGWMDGMGQAYFQIVKAIYLSATKVGIQLCFPGG